MLFLINITTSPDVLWFYWPLLGWGIGIVMHAVYVFGFEHWFGPDWEEKTQYDLVGHLACRSPFFYDSLALADGAANTSARATQSLQS
jgi:hypothetical protein